MKPEQKEAKLKEQIAAYGSLAIAFSGGVDSSYLADVAHEVLGTQARMVLADSPSIPREEVADALALAKEKGWNLTVIKTQEFENEAFLENNGTRCYFCKSELFAKMHGFAQESAVRYLAYGEIADDAMDPTRLGAKAAKEYQVVAPLAEAGMGKDDIRQRSKERGLPTWDKASFACLSSRFPTGHRIDLQQMLQVERAEQLLRQVGFRQFRARHHGDICRIEVELEDLPRAVEPAVRDMLVEGLRKVGYRHVALDLAGYRTGSTAAAPAAARET